MINNHNLNILESGFSINKLLEDESLAEYGKIILSIVLCFDVSHTCVVFVVLCRTILLERSESRVVKKFFRLVQGSGVQWRVT